MHSRGSACVSGVPGRARVRYTHMRNALLDYIAKGCRESVSLCVGVCECCVLIFVRAFGFSHTNTDIFTERKTK